jgi:hypothetical protein
MASPPESTKTSLRQRLQARAHDRWPKLAEATTRHRGAFAYVSGRLADGTTLPLFRLRYAGSASTWGFAIPRGNTRGSPGDCACGLYLNDHTAWLKPPTN